MVERVSLEEEKTLKALQELERLARLLDTQWRIPFTRIRFGLDAAAGLIPGIGDGAAAIVGAGIIMGAARHGAPNHVLARMFFNLVLDTAVGSVPIAGTVFDVWYKANKRNVGLWRDYLMQKGKIIEAEPVHVPAARRPSSAPQQARGSSSRRDDR